MTIYEATPVLIASFLHLAVFLPVTWCLTPCLELSERRGFILFHFNRTLKWKLLNKIYKEYCKKATYFSVEINVIVKDRKKNRGIDRKNRGNGFIW